MDNNLDYYLKYINFQGSPQDNISELSSAYNTQMSNAVSVFNIRINSNEAILIRVNDKLSQITYKALLFARNLKNEAENTIKTRLQTYLGIVKHGDYIYYNNETYLIISKVEDKPVYAPEYSEAVLKLCNNNLKFITPVNGVNTIMSIPCVISSTSLDVEDSKYIETQDNTLTCSIGTSYIDKIKYIKDGMRFIINDKAYKTIGINNATNVFGDNGVISIKLESVETNESDDLENGIADRWLYETKPNYTFEFPSEVTFTRYEEVRFDFIIKNNGVVVNNPTLVKSSSNTSVVNYQSNQWICVGYGTSNFTITYQGIDKIYTNVVKVNVVQSQPITYTYTVTSNDGIFNLEQYVARIYTCNRFENGKGVPSKYNITIDYNGHSTSLISIENITDNSIQIRNNTGNGQVIYIVFKDIQTNIETRQAITLLEF